MLEEVIIQCREELSSIQIKSRGDWEILMERAQKLEMEAKE